MKLTAASVGRVDRDPLLAIAQGRGEGAQGDGGALGVAVAGGGEGWCGVGSVRIM